MPFGYQCRTRIFKQVPAKPTVRTLAISQETGTPGPGQYEPPKICGGNGFSKIKRAPAYSFGRKLKPCFAPTTFPNVPLFNVSGFSKKGVYKIPGGLMTPNNKFLGSKTKMPGPAAYYPVLRIGIKRAPVYSLRLAAKPPYQPPDSWTPSPNMYCPPIPKKRAPAYTFADRKLPISKTKTPGPGEHNPKHEYIQKRKTDFSFGTQFRPYLRIEVTPAPNNYCEKKFMVNKPSIPAPSFGIRHSPYLGKPKVCLKPSDLEQRITRV